MSHKLIEIEGHASSSEGQQRIIFGHRRLIPGSPECYVLVIGGHLWIIGGVILGSLGGNFGIIGGQFWDHAGVGFWQLLVLKSLSDIEI